ncbi:MAG: hypothetical protein C5B48_04875 [Candidatus Rokuibacteriota bacterium]|nr:MAG: hypothetical protein C5B48_04875 [Candidatus Rokubacteria bacterium]
MRRRFARAASVVFAAALAALLLLPGLGAAPFDDPGEGQHAEIAREMAATGDWLVPRLNGVRYFDKPPLLYWMGAASFSTVGLHEGAARLWPFLGTVLAAAATAALGARLMGPSGGVLAVGALLSSALFVAYGRYVRPETLFVAAIQWALAALLSGLDEPEPRRARLLTLIGCGALGLAALAKDPIGLLAPLIAVALTLSVHGRLRPVSRWLSVPGVIALLLVGVAWYAIVALRERGFLWYTIVDNHLLNAVRLRQFPDEDVPLGALEFLAVSALGALPWIIPAAFGVASIVRGRLWRNPAEMSWTALALWSVGVFGLFALVPFKLPHYALPAYPAIALLAARTWQAGARGLIVVHLMLFALIAGLLGLAAASDGRAFLGAVLSATDVYTRKEAAVGLAAPFPPWSALAPVVTTCALVFAAGSAALLAVLIARAHRLAPWVVLATMVAAMPAVTTTMSAVAKSRAVRGLALEIRRELGPDDLLVHEGPIENAGALEFYSGRRPILLEATRSVLGFGATFADTREVFWDAERFHREWCTGRRILLVTARAPEQSIAARLPAQSLRLRAIQNGRWLYDSGLRGPRGDC